MLLLILSIFLKVTALPRAVDKRFDHSPDILIAVFVKCRDGFNLWNPVAVLRWEEVNRTFQFCFGQICRLNIISVGFVDKNPVSHFHYPAFNPLQLITGTGEHQQHEKICH